MKHPGRWLLVLWVILVTAMPNPCAGLSLLRITPSGDDVPAANQIVLEFDRPVAALGEGWVTPDRFPISISPPPPCQWQWIGPETLSCRLPTETPLQKATAYDVVLSQSLTGLDGSKLGETARHRFVTERPKAQYAWVEEWQGPGIPILRVGFNQPVFQNSVIAALAFQDESGQNFPCIAETHPDDTTPARYAAEDTAHTNPAREIWLAYPMAPLPKDQKISLVVSKGVRSAEGSEPGEPAGPIDSFRTFPDFRFEGIFCTDHAGNPIQVRPDGAKAASSPACNPLFGIYVVFTAPVSTDILKKRLRLTPPMAISGPSDDPWANAQGTDALEPISGATEEPYTHMIRIPRRLKADTEYHLSLDTTGFIDRFDRPISGPNALFFRTSHRNPNFVLTHKNSVLEKRADTETPVVVTNLDTLTIDYRRVLTGERETRDRSVIAIPEAADIGFNVPLGIREMLKGRSGAIRGTVTSTPAVKQSEWAASFFAQVTPFHVHVKLGHFDTLAWVTDLSSGQAVPAATVTLYQAKGDDLERTTENYRTAETDANGIARLPGLSTLDPNLSLLHGYAPNAPKLFVRVEKAGDMALLPLVYDFSVDTFRASRELIFPRPKTEHGHLQAWGFTAQGVYRPGDMVDYKVYVRDHDNRDLSPPPAGGYTLRVTDSKGDDVWTEKGVRLSKFGAVHGRFRLEKSAASGGYQIRISAPFIPENLDAATFLVTDFTPAPFHVSTEVNGRIFHAGQLMTIDTQALLHAGGPFSNARGRVTATLEQRAFSTDLPKATGFSFDAPTQDPESPAEEVLLDREITLDAQGQAENRIEIPETRIVYGRIQIESAISDDRGKRIAGRTGADFFGRDRFIGLRHDAWTLEQGMPSMVEVLVLTREGTPIATDPITLIVERKQTHAARVKGAGNAYITRYTHQWIKEWETRTATGTDPTSVSFTPQGTGEYRIRAEAMDGAGKPIATEIEAWADGKGQVVWEEEPDNSLDIIPDKRTYTEGETVSCLVKNPFPGAKALVTLERYGVLKSWIETFDTATPMVRFPVTAQDAPGFYLSVVVMSPRQATASRANGSIDDVDLGKPTFRMGYTPIQVTRTTTTLPVTATPEAAEYRPGDQIRVRLNAQTDAALPVEFAVAVVDEAVLDLLPKGRRYYDPHEGFQGLDPLDLLNYNIVQGLVGRVRFEKKGARAGGDGGVGARLRDVASFIAYWNPSLAADETGSAAFSFAAPDNLTGWRILAVAVTPASPMGLGEARVSVNRLTEVRPILPNRVLSGDQFDAAFSVMNRTESPRTLSVHLTAQGAVEKPVTLTQTITAPPFERVRVPFSVQAGPAGTIRFTATAKDALDADGLQKDLEVAPAHRIEETAFIGEHAGPGNLEIPVALPVDIQPDTGTIDISVTTSPMGDLTGPFRSLKEYPHTCWEQRITRAMAAALYLRLKDRTRSDFSWDTAAKEIDTTLAEASRFQASNGGMGFFTPEPTRVSPFLSAYTALSFSYLKSCGHTIPKPVQKRLHAYLQGLLRQKPSGGEDERSMATVRAMILTAFAEGGGIGREDLERVRPHLSAMDLFGLSLFVRAASHVDGSATMIQDALKRVLSKLDWTEGRLSLAGDSQEPGYRMLDSHERTAGALLWALVGLDRKATPGTVASDPARVARYLNIAKSPSGSWGSTQGTIFSLMGLAAFAEGKTGTPTPQKIEWTARYDGIAFGTAGMPPGHAAPVVFSRAIAPSEAGGKGVLTVSQPAPSQYFYEARVRHAPTRLPDRETHHGIDLKRAHYVKENGTWRPLTDADTLSVGHEIAVVLDVGVPATRPFVAVTDPLPGCLEPVNRDLATTVQETPSEKAPWAEGPEAMDRIQQTRWYFYHQELGHDSARFYSENLPPGQYRLVYEAQVITPGRFTTLPARAEEMYDAAVFGETPSRTMTVNRP